MLYEYCEVVLELLVIEVFFVIVYFVRCILWMILKLNRKCGILFGFGLKV